MTAMRPSLAKMDLRRKKKGVMWKTGLDIPIVNLVTGMRERTHHRSGNVESRDANCLDIIDGVDPAPEK